MAPDPTSPGRSSRVAELFSPAPFIEHLLASTIVPAILMITWASATDAVAQGVVRDSIGATSSGRGGTNIAHADNLTVILDNPAALVNIPEDDRFDFSLDILATDLDYTDPENNANGEVKPFPLPTFARSKKSDSGRFAYAIGVFAPAGFGAQYKLRHPLYGKQRYASLGALVKILPAFALKVDEHLSVGATFGLAISHVQLREPFNLQTGVFAGLPTLINLKSTGVAPTWSLGMQYKISPATTFGLRFISETRFRLKGDAKVDISGFGLPLLKSRYDAQVDIVWPRSVGAGITHRFNARHSASADVVWYDWSHAFDKIDLKLTNGANPLFNLLLGSKVRDRLPLDWEDSIAYRFGYEYSPTADDVIRLGYIYHDNPIPNNTLFPLLAGTLEHAATIGYGHQWKKWRFDVAYQYSWGSTNKVGRSRIVGGDFDHSSVKAQAHWLFLGISYRF